MRPRCRRREESGGRAWRLGTRFPRMPAVSGSAGWEAERVHSTGDGLGARKLQGEPHSSSKRKGEPHAGRFPQVQSLELDHSDNRLPVFWGPPEISTCGGSLKEDITQALQLFLCVFICDVLHSIHNNQVYETVRRYEWIPSNTTGNRNRPTKAKNKGVIRHRIEKNTHYS